MNAAWPIWTVDGRCSKIGNTPMILFTVLHAGMIPQIILCICFTSTVYAMSESVAKKKEAKHRPRDTRLSQAKIRQVFVV